MIIGVAIGVIVVLVVLATVMGGNNNKNPNNAEYNYSLSNTTSFTNRDGGTTKASAGNEFIIATITLKNTNYADGIKSSFATMFKLNTGEFTYDYTFTKTYNHPDRLDPDLTINKGSKATFVLVFEVPIGTTGGTLEWHGDFYIKKVVYNSSLV